MSFISCIRVACAIEATMFKTARGVRTSWCWGLVPVKADWASSLTGGELGSERMSGTVAECSLGMLFEFSSPSLDEWDVLKQWLHSLELPLLENAKLYNVGSIVNQLLDGFVAALWRKRRS